MKAVAYFGLAALCLALNTWLTVASLRVNSYGLAVLLNRGNEIWYLRAGLNAGTVGFTLAALCVIAKPATRAMMLWLTRPPQSRLRALGWCAIAVGTVLLFAVGTALGPRSTHSTPKSDAAKIHFEPDEFLAQPEPSRSAGLFNDVIPKPRRATPDADWGKFDEVITPAPRQKLPGAAEFLDSPAAPLRALPVTATPRPQGAR